MDVFIKVLAFGDTLFRCWVIRGLVNENQIFRQYIIPYRTCSSTQTWRPIHFHSKIVLFNVHFSILGQVIPLLSYAWISASKHRFLAKTDSASHLQQHWVLVTYTFWFRKWSFSIIFLAFGDKLFRCWVIHGLMNENQIFRQYQFHIATCSSYWDWWTIHFHSKNSPFQCSLYHLGQVIPLLSYGWISTSKTRFLVKPILPHTCSNTESWWPIHFDLENGPFQ